MKIVHFEHIDEYRNNRQELLKLRREYGISVPEFDIVVGGPTEGRNRCTYYIISDRIEGEDLQRIEFKPEEMDDAALKIDHCFSGVGKYLTDVTKRDGGYISDLTVGFGLWEGSGNEQYMYGTRPGEQKKQVYLVDLGPTLANYTTKDNGSHSQFYDRVIPHLYDMISIIEKKLAGRKLEKARSTLYDLVKPVPPSNKYFEKMQDVANKLEADRR